MAQVLSSATVISDPLIKKSKTPTPKQNSREKRGSQKPQGFALYIGASEADLLASDTTLTQLVAELRNRLQQLAPNATSYATIAFAPENLSDDSLDLVRYALHEPGARKKYQSQAAVTIDLLRQKITISGKELALTFRELKLLGLFAGNPGTNFSRVQLCDYLEQTSGAGRISARSIDVQIRRLRIKLGDYQEIIRTVHGSGYCFAQHPEVKIVTN